MKYQSKVVEAGSVLFPEFKNVRPNVPGFDF